MFRLLSGLTCTTVNSLNQLSKLLFCRRFLYVFKCCDNNIAKIIGCQELICAKLIDLRYSLRYIICTMILYVV